jgi:hypothetical protein
MVNTLTFYASHLALRSRAPRPHLRDGNRKQGPQDLLQVLDSAAAVLAAVARDAGPDLRGFHPAGMADAEGFVAMGCAEVLIHTEDIAATLGDGYRGPDELTDRVVRRLFPWAPEHPEPWERFRWCTGRAALPTHERQGADWWWHCAPLDEWEGGTRVRTEPPGWR